MITPGFIKRYHTPYAAIAACAHRDWLAGLEADVLLPAVRAVDPYHVEFEHLGHHQPGPGDLSVLAQTLGRLHATAYTKQLHAARLDEPFRASGDLIIGDFLTARREALQRIPLPVTGFPVAFYKDANIRNFLLTDDGVAIVDFDDLTLAPFGYDLAKLIVSTAMTHGHLDPDEVEQVLNVYNIHTIDAAGPVTACPMEWLQIYSEFHYLLTARYLHRNGYHYAWPNVRPWREVKMPW